MSDTNADEPKRDRRRSTRITDGLSAADIWRAIDEWRLNGRDSFLRTFGGTQAQKYVVIDGDDEFDALALLRGARRLAGLHVDPGYRGDRRNVADPPRRFGFLVENLDSETESPVSAEASEIQRWLRTFSGLTDQWSLRKARHEQAILRGALGIGTGEASRLHEAPRV